MRRYGKQHGLKFILAKFDMRFPTMRYMRPTKPHISLRIRALWSAQSDQSISESLAYSMSVKLLPELHVEFPSLKGGSTCSSGSTLIQMPHCWKSHVAAHLCCCCCCCCCFCLFYFFVLASLNFSYA